MFFFVNLIKIQGGFRLSYSTIDNDFIVYSSIMKYLFQKRRKLYFAFIDFNNAFDGVERVTLNTALLRKAYVCSEGYLQI